MNNVAIKNFIMTWVVLILAIALLSAAHNWVYPNPIVRQRLEVVEAFEAQQKKVIESPVGDTDTIASLAPAPVDLSKKREPYSLLADVLKPFTGAPTSPTSKTCYEADFQTRLERTGNFRQMTNNYKRGVPDSCSSPNHDLLLSFYKVDPLP
jgi:hypothetical protein